MDPTLHFLTQMDTVWAMERLQQKKVPLWIGLVMGHDDELDMMISQLLTGYLNIQKKGKDSECYTHELLVSSVS
jgi:hypothetical protein